MAGESIIKFFFHLSQSVKLYHWQTKIFARHKATCDLFAQLSTLTDDFVEVYMGRYGRPNFNGAFKLTIKELTEENAPQYISECVEFLEKNLPKYLKETDTELLNIRDEMLSNLNKTLYLFTLQ